MATPSFRDDLSGDTFEDIADPTEVLVCAPKFESFLRRFWSSSQDNFEPGHP